jgi:phage gpG-like protein
MRIEIDVDAADAIAYLRRMEERAENFSSVFRWAKQELRKANAENFTKNGLPSGGWNPRTRDYAWPIMRKSGALFRSLTSLNGAPNEIHKTHAYFGTKVEYAKFHQYGTTRMPARKVVFTPVGFAKSVGERAAKHIVGLRGDLFS